MPSGNPTMPVEAPGVATCTSVKPDGTVAAEAFGAPKSTTGISTDVTIKATAAHFRIWSPLSSRPRTNVTRLGSAHRVAWQYPRYRQLIGGVALGEVGVLLGIEEQ